MALYTVAELEAMPTVSVGQADDLKISEPGYRVWLSRVDQDMISIEQLINGKWVVTEEYWGE